MITDIAIFITVVVSVLALVLWDMHNQDKQ